MRGGGSSETFPTRPPEPSLPSRLGTVASWGAEAGGGAGCGTPAPVLVPALVLPHTRQGLEFLRWSQDRVRADFWKLLPG